MKIALIALICSPSQDDEKKLTFKKAYKHNLIQDKEARELGDLYDLLHIVNYRREMDDDTSTAEEDSTGETVATTPTTTTKPEVTRTSDSATDDDVEDETITTAATTSETTTAETTTKPSEGTEDDFTSETVATTPETTPETSTTPATTTTQDTTTTPAVTTPEGTTPLPVAECKYPLKKVYKRKDNGKEVIRTLNTQTGITYYSSNCNVDSYGNITIDTSKVTNGIVKCQITCAGDGYTGSYGYYLYQVAEYKPTMDELLTTFPYKIYPNEEFNATLVLKYPIIVGDDSLVRENLTMKISLNTTGYAFNNQESDFLVTSDILFAYNNLNITTDKTGNGTITFKFTNATLDYKFDYEGVKIAAKEEAESCPLDKRDPMGVCCSDAEKDTTNGIMCKNLTTTVTFVNRVDDTLLEAYNNLIDAMFSRTNYIYEVLLEPTNRKKIFVPMNIRKEETPRLRRIQDATEIKLTDFNLAKSLLSVLECTSEEEVEAKIELLPPEVKQQVQTANIKETIKAEVKNVVNKAEETGNTIDYSVPIEISNDIDVAAGIEETPEPTTPAPTLPKDEEDDDPWAKKYWYVIFIIVLVVVIILVIVGVIAYMNINKSMKQSKQQKAEKIMESTVQIEQVKQENKVTEDDIYKPFSYEVIIEGYLMKEGRDRIVDKWQRRYCVLYYEPATLRIYDSMVPSYYGKVYIDEKQSIPLNCYSGIEYSDGASDFTLVLKINESNLKTFEPGEVERKVHFKVEGENGEATAKKWVQCFRDFKSQKPKSDEAWTQPVLMDNAEGRYATTTESQLYDRNMTALERAQKRRQEIRKMTPKHPY